MATQDTSKENKEEIEQGFPIQLKLLLAVIVIAVVAIMAKIIGIY
jgi:hypothetical protein